MSSIIIYRFFVLCKITWLLNSIISRVPHWLPNQKDQNWHWNIVISMNVVSVIFFIIIDCKWLQNGNNYNACVLLEYLLLMYTGWVFGLSTFYLSQVGVIWAVTCIILVAKHTTETEKINDFQPSFPLLWSTDYFKMPTGTLFKLGVIKLQC